MTTNPAGEQRIMMASVTGVHPDDQAEDRPDRVDDRSGDPTGDQWVFGYGSLIWRPAFRYREQRAGYIVGFERRFWQASTDHRGIPEAPGRVVTLVPVEQGVCWGMAYRIAAADRQRILAELDHREKGGYQKLTVDVHFVTRAEVDFQNISTVPALVYIGTVDNPSYAGPSPIEDIARIVRTAHGPSGANHEYVLRLAAALADMGVVDPHVAELASHLTEPATGCPGVPVEPGAPDARANRSHEPEKPRDKRA